MNNTDCTTATANALIVFLKYPQPGAVKTRLAADIGNVQAADVYRRLTEQTLKKLAPDHQFCTTMFFTPSEREDDVRQWLNPLLGPVNLAAQREGDLGSRMADAFYRTFSIPGAEKVVIIGTDCPRISTAIIAEAFHALATSPVVIGPARDGGYYLLGLNTPSPWLFENLAWSTASVFPETIQRLKEREINYVLLPELQDIDTIEDLLELWPDWNKNLVTEPEGL